MGSCCSSESALDDDATPNSRPYQSQGPPRQQKPRVNKATGHTLGSGETGVDPRTAAALAAEQRNQEIAKGGKLATQLAADRGKSRNQHLMDASLESRQGGQQNLQWD